MGSRQSKRRFELRFARGEFQSGPRRIRGLRHQLKVAGCVFALAAATIIIRLSAMLAVFTGLTAALVGALLIYLEAFAVAFAAVRLFAPARNSWGKQDFGIGAILTS